VNIAIVRLSSLGDIIFCMAALQVIKRHCPDARITWFADRRFADVLDHNPDLERVVKMDWRGVKREFSLEGVRREYRLLREQGRFDLAIDLHGMLKSALTASLVSNRRVGFHRSLIKEPLATLLYGQTWKVAREWPAARRFAELAAAALGFGFAEQELVEKECYLFCAAEDREFVARFFSRSGKNVLLVPGSSAGYKNYPKEKYLQVARQLDAHFLVCHGSENERQVAQFLAERCDRVTVLPRLNLNQLKGAVAAADLVIGGDTGPTHMAWACNVPSVTLYGATPANCVYPGPRCRILKSSSVVREERPDKNDFSIAELRAEEIVAAARELLS